MSYTDRAYLKQQQAGTLGTTGAANAILEIQDVHRRSRDYTKVGTENAATNVAETLMFTVRRLTQVSEFLYLTGTNVANDNTDYVVFTISKKTAGAGTKTVATYNTHTGAQGKIVKDIPASFSVVANSDSLLADGDTVHYTVAKIAAGQAVAIGTFTLDGEEV